MALLRVVAGIAAAALVLGVAELVAVFTGTGSAPAYALGATVVDHTPDGLREWAIQSFGRNDKAVLFVCMGIVAVLVAGLAGWFERVTRPVGSVVFAVFGLIAAGPAVAPAPTTVSPAVSAPAAASPVDPGGVDASSMRRVSPRNARIPAAVPIRAGSAPPNPPTRPAPMTCLLYTSPSPRDGLLSRMPSSA